MSDHHSPLLEDAPPPSESEPRGKPRAPRPYLRWILLSIVLLFAAAVYFLWPRNTGAKPGAQNQKGPPAAPVVVAKASKGDIGVYFTGLGAVTPLFTVTVKSRVDGQLMRVNYNESALVHEGELLAEIDQRPYEVQLTQAEGQLAKDQAALENAKTDLSRYEILLTHNAVAEQQFATQQATVQQDEGAVKVDQGQVDNAKLNIVYCRITAPITGRVGLRLVDPGNMVHASDANGLVVITQVQPISVIFTVAEDQLPPILKKFRAGQKLEVDAYDRAMTTKVATGKLETIDNQIDQTTGTLKLRANFDNNDNALFPNQFVNVRLLVEEKRGVTLVPSAVIQRNSQQTYVYLVKPDSTVTVRQVKIGTTEGDQSEITDGLSPGDEIVMTGVDRLQEGSKVNAQTEGEEGAGANTGNSGGSQQQNHNQQPNQNQQQNPNQHPGKNDAGKQTGKPNGK